MKKYVSAAEYVVYIILFNIMIFIAGPINREVLIYDFSLRNTLTFSECSLKRYFRFVLR